jgi:hypothetical protein
MSVWSLPGGAWPYGVVVLRPDYPITCRASNTKEAHMAEGKCHVEIVYCVV